MITAAINLVWKGETQSFRVWPGVVVTSMREGTIIWPPSSMIRVAAISPFHLDRDRRLMLLKDRDASRLRSLHLLSSSSCTPPTFTDFESKHITVTVRMPGISYCSLYCIKHLKNSTFSSFKTSMLMLFTFQPPHEGWEEMNFGIIIHYKFSPKF